MKESIHKTIMEKGSASAHPTNGVVEDEGKRNNRRLQSSVDARSWRPS